MALSRSVRWAGTLILTPPRPAIPGLLRLAGTGHRPLLACLPGRCLVVEVNSRQASPKHSQGLIYNAIPVIVHAL